MKRAQIIVLAIAVAAGGGALMLMNGQTPPAPQPVVVAAPPPVAMTEVLVASIDMQTGHRIQPTELRWQPWPVDAVPAGMVTRDTRPNGVEETMHSVVRFALAAGEPIRPEKLIRADGAGFMSALLPSGMRAIAINIDRVGATSAGGFILPNDRVDIIRTYRDDESSRTKNSDVQVSRTILSNIKILAIGQTVQERDGERVVTGETATLEVTPAQAELLTVAQRGGLLSLALRSLQDANRTVEAVEPRTETGLTVVRFGLAQQTSK